MRQTEIQINKVLEVMENEGMLENTTEEQQRVLRQQLKMIAGCAILDAKSQAANELNELYRVTIKEF